MRVTTSSEAAPATMRRAAGTTASEGAPGADPFAGLTLDDDFVRSATVSEPDAAQRRAEAEDRRRREADLRRRLEQDTGGRGAAAPESQRLAPSGWDDDAAWDDDEDEPRPRRRSATVRTVAILLVAAMVGTYAVTHLLVILRS